MNINLDMVLVIQSILCVHAELKLKLKNISFSVVNFKVLKDQRLELFENIENLKCTESNSYFIVWFSNQFRNY